LNPDAKKKLAAMQGVKQKADTNFDFQAQRDAAMPALQESPDHIYGVHGKGSSDMWWHDERPTYAFFAFKEFSIFGEGYTHQEIFRQITRTWEYKKRTVEYFENMGIVVSNPEKFLDDLFLEGGALASYMRDPVDHIREMKDALLGRLWPNLEIISFWNPRSEVIKNWSFVEKMFKDNIIKFGGLNHYKVDWVERNSGNIPFTPAKRVKASDRKPTLDPAELKRLMAQQHIDPAAKKKLAAALMTLKQKVPSGFDFAAQKAAAIPALQEILKSILPR
jgi:hypothetical protein